MKSHDVRFWETRLNKTAKRPTYVVRWTVGGREKSHTLAGKARAERYKARLIQAADKGEAFDTETGLPDSMAREVSQVTWYQHACEFMDARWPKHAAKGRVSLAEGLIAVTAGPGQESARCTRSWRAAPGAPQVGVQSAATRHRASARGGCSVALAGESLGPGIGTGRGAHGQ